MDDLPIHCTLVENAVDYLLLAGEQAQVETPRMIKHAIANLADGIELLLKARLEIKDWRLLFSKPENADENAFRRGEFKSVYSVDIPARLAESCAVTLTQAQIGLIDLLRKARNKIRHFAISTTRSALSPLIVRTYGFALDFLHEHFEPTHLAPPVGPLLAEIRQLLAENQEFIADRLAHLPLMPERAVEVIGVECPECAENSLYRWWIGQMSILQRSTRPVTHGARLRIHSVSRLVAWRRSRRASYLELPRVRRAGRYSSGRWLGRADYVCLACATRGNYAECCDCSNLFVPTPFDDDGHPSSRCDECGQSLFDKE